MNGCTVDHQGIKLDPCRWGQLALCGYTHLEASDEEPEETHELRNCACGTTLVIVVPTEQRRAA